MNAFFLPILLTYLEHLVNYFLHQKYLDPTTFLVIYCYSVKDAPNGAIMRGLSAFFVHF